MNGPGNLLARGGRSFQATLGKASMITVSLETMKIVRALPPLDID